MMAQQRTALPIARNVLIRIWLFGSILPFGVLVINSILGKYDGVEDQAWGWFCPLVFPTITLMLGIVGAGALARGATSEKYVNRFFFRLCCGLSLGYLILISLVIFLEPLSHSPSITVLVKSNLFLAPMQGVATAAIAFLFSSHVGKAGD